MTNHRAIPSRIGSALVVLAAIAAVTILPASASAAATTTLSAQTAYNCQLFTSPPPPDMYNASVTASIQLTAPASVSPGQTINLSGTLTLQFPESIRAVAIAGGFNTVQGYSTTINVGVDAAGQSSDVFADEWQTPPTQVGNPLQVTGVLTLPPMTVPKNATGTYELQMPENGATPNTVESSPARVAFTAVATASGPGGTSPIKVACYLPGSSPELGQIPIVAAPAAAAATPTKTSAAKSSAASTAAAASSSGATKASGVKTTAAATTKATHATQASGTTKAAQATQSAAATSASAATPAASATPSAAASGTSGGGTSGASSGTAAASSGTASAGSSGSSGTAQASPATSGQSATADTGAATPVASSTATPATGAVDAVVAPGSSSTSTRSGLYVSSTLLVLGGFLVCLASIGYALLTNYRLNAIRRELDD